MLTESDPGLTLDWVAGDGLGAALIPEGGIVDATLDSGVLPP